MKIYTFKNKLFRFAVSLLKDENEAEDVVQEVVIKLWKHRDRLDQINNLEAWSMKLTKNLSLDKMRSKHRRNESLDAAYSLSAKQKNPEQQLELNDTVQRLKSWMYKLPEKQRLVFQLRDIEGLSYNEISELLDMSLNQVKTNLFRARQAAKKYLIKNNDYEL
ncbi:MAG: sigma-70 family RNA polymerase sigma factor [Bacteroidota bacterium]